MKTITTALSGAFAIAFATSIATTSANATATVSILEPTATSIHEALLAQMEQNDFSGAIVIERGGLPVLEAGYGYAERETETPFTVDTVAQIDSNAKQFTALAVLLLAEDGALDLNTPISTYLPDVPDHVGVVTLTQLLSHSAGMPDLCSRNDYRPLSRDQMIAECLDDPLLFEPGTAAEYSNLGFSIAAAIVEVVSGQTLEDFLQERVWGPNNLNTFAYTYPEDTDFTLAFGYEGEEARRPINEHFAEMNGDFWIVKGNGALQASASDMRNWNHVMRGEGTLSQEFLQRYTSPVFETAPGEYEGYGQLIVTGSDGEVAQISHAGSDGVFFSYIYWDRQNDIFLYFVGNAGAERTEAALMEVFGHMSDLL